MLVCTCRPKVTITFFTNALRREDSLEYSAIQCRLAMKDKSAGSWVWHVQSLLQRYRLPSAFKLLHEQPSKEQWKYRVRKAMPTLWEKPLKDEAWTKKTLDYINLHACNLHTPHPVWQVGAATP